jgi:tRNA(His) 5'-end guanylyltransferase
MTDKTTLGDRMKEYEATSQTHLLRRTPVIIRVDGRAFHTFTKRLIGQLPPKKDRWDTQDRWVVDPSMIETPFSVMMHNTMVGTAGWLFHEIQNAMFVYTQSDEISILLRDWDRHETQQWFGSNVQKMCSLSASIATAAFNYCFSYNTCTRPTWAGDLATFDSRVYNLPKEEVANYFIWRQQDASRNSVQMYARHFFSHKQLHGLSNSQIQDKLVLEHQKNWNDLPTWMRRGSCVYQDPEWCWASSAPRSKKDDDIPIFTQDRNYVEQWLTPQNDDRVDIMDFEPEMTP